MKSVSFADLATSHAPYVTIIFMHHTFMVHTFPKSMPIKRLQTQSITLKVYQDGAETFQLHIALQNHSLAATMDDQEKSLSSPLSNDVTHNKISTHYTVLSTLVHVGYISTGEVLK